MVWLRSKAKRLSLLALFALALQFGLSFGHVHGGQAAASKTTVIGLASPASPDSGNDADGRADQCAICATIALANALIDSPPPVLPLPAEATAPDIFVAPVAIDSSQRPLGFQSRAPPIA